MRNTQSSACSIGLQPLTGDDLSRDYNVAHVQTHDCVTLVLLVRGVKLTIVLLLGEALSTSIYVGYSLLKEGHASFIAV